MHIPILQYDNTDYLNTFLHTMYITIAYTHDNYFPSVNIPHQKSFPLAHHMHALKIT